MSAKMEAALCMATAIRWAKPHLLKSAEAVGVMSPSGQALLDALGAWEAACKQVKE